MSILPHPSHATTTPPILLDLQDGTVGRWGRVDAGLARLGDVVELDGGPLWGRIQTRRHVGGRVVLELCVPLLAARRVLSCQPGEPLRVFRCLEISQQTKHAHTSLDIL